MDRLAGEKGERPVLWDQDDLRVELDHGCFAEMTWRVSFAAPVDIAALAERLVRMGFRDEGRFPRVRELEEGAGHRLVLVPSTGRIQLRLHYLTARERRRDEARRIAALLVAARAAM